MRAKIMKALGSRDVHGVADKVREILVGGGLRQEEASQVLRMLGYRAAPEVDLESLFHLAHVFKTNGEATGTLKRGALKQIWSYCAAIWEQQSGQPGYGSEQFRKAYAAWVKRGCVTPMTKEEQAVEAWLQRRRDAIRINVLLDNLNSRIKRLAK